MSTITETIKEEALFIPGDTTTNGVTEKEYTPKTEGEYLGHITELTTTLPDPFELRDRNGANLGRKARARFFNFKVRVAPETAELTFTHRDHKGAERTHNGVDYVGWEVRGGIPRFLEPTVDDDFEANPEGNDAYVRFCETQGIEIPTREIERDGKTLTVQVLPELTAEDITGVPVTAVVGRGRDWTNKEGETVPAYKVKFVKEWTDGKRLAGTTTDDLPF